MYLEIRQIAAGISLMSLPAFSVNGIDKSTQSKIKVKSENLTLYLYEIVGKLKKYQTSKPACGN